MSNNLFNDMNKKQFLSAYDQFAAQFKGDPQAEVMRLLQTGQMSQQQFNQLQNMATQLRGLLPKR
jgi:hypothetical protein